MHPQSFEEQIKEVQELLDNAYAEPEPNQGEIEELEHQLDQLYFELDQSQMTIYK